VEVLSLRKYSRSIDGLIGDARYFNLLLTHLLNLSYMCVCGILCRSVYLVYCCISLSEINRKKLYCNC